MNRREFIGLTAAVTAAMPQGAGADDVACVHGLIAARLAKGETTFVDQFATRCATCAAQQRAITELRAENPAHDQAITFVRADRDMYETDALTTGPKIPRRSTLAVLKGDRELGRIVAGTAKDQITALPDAGPGAPSRP